MSKDRGSGKPSHIAYHVREGSDDKAHFNRIGAAFKHKDGKGFNLQLDSTPVDGRVTLRTPQDRLDEKREAPRDERRSRSRERDDYDRD